MTQQRNLIVKVKTSKWGYILKDENYGMHTVYLLEPNVVTQLEIKRLILMQGLYPVSFTSIDELISQSMESRPDFLLIGINSYKELDYIRKIKKHQSLNDIFVVVTGMLKNGAKIAYENGAEIYFAKPLVWKILPFITHTVIFINELRTHSDTKCDIISEIKLNFDTKGDNIMELQF